VFPMTTKEYLELKKKRTNPWFFFIFEESFLLNNSNDGDEKKNNDKKVQEFLEKNDKEEKEKTEDSDQNVNKKDETIMNQTEKKEEKKITPIKKNEKIKIDEEKYQPKNQYNWLTDEEEEEYDDLILKAPVQIPKSKNSTEKKKLIEPVDYLEKKIDQGKACYLNKSGERNRQFQKRYCIIRSVFLSYYKNHSVLKKEKGNILLQGSLIENITEKESSLEFKKNYIISISESKRVWILGANDEREFINFSLLLKKSSFRFQGILFFSSSRKLVGG
jgi:hypothetical protein